MAGEIDPDTRRLPMNDSATYTNGETRWSRRYRATTDTIAAARHDAAEWAEEVGADDVEVERIVLIVSELVSNAVEATEDHYDLALWATSDSWRIRVTNRAAPGAIPPRDDWGPDDILSLRGRGLAIVETLASHVLVDHDGGRVVVTALMDR